MNFQVPGVGEKRQKAVHASLSAALASHPGKWHVQFIGNRGDDVWELRLSGPAVETSAYIDASSDPEALARTISAMAGEASSPPDLSSGPDGS